MSRSLHVPPWRLAAAVLLLAASPLAAADPPGVRELRTQQVGDTTYFHVRFDAPPKLRLPQVEQTPASDLQRWKLALLPRLVPQDGHARAVYPRVLIPAYRPTVGFDGTARDAVPVEGLEFVGQVRTPGKARFLLIYPTLDMARGFTDPAREGWVEMPVELDFAAAVRPAAPSEKRPAGRNNAARDDLRGLWAEAQAARFAVLEILAPEFGFHGFAAEATARKYGVHAPMLEPPDPKRRELAHRRLYEMTTGTAAITESLALHRLLNRTFRDDGQRVVDIAKVPGITIAEHPWEKMMAGQKPAPEPLAKLVPHDHFYVHFKNIRKFLELGDLFDQWGTSAARAYEMNSRDYDMKGRYERQLCLRSTGLARTFGPAVVRNLALCGSDGYLREGSDVTVLFHVANRKLFLAAVEPFLQEARKQHGPELKENKADYHGVTVESYVTPLREVSLHRAVFGEFVVYSNSPVALRRILDTHQGRSKALADSLDFQYMRTVFRLDDAAEDGFAFLSDAFIRQLVGPASKIKAKRRLEALTSLHMVTHAALFTAWETGKLPADHEALLSASALKPAEVYTPEGTGVTWHPGKRAAVSEVYNTLHFPTPLIELPIDRITRAEEQEYLQFRSQYMQLWRQFFDPVGMRFALDRERVRIDTYILPLLNSGEYSFLRQFAAGGTTKLDLSSISATTLIQGTLHITPEIRKSLEQFVQGKSGVGEWFLLRLDDSDVFRKYADVWVQSAFNPEARRMLEHDVFWIARLPLTAGIQVRDPKLAAAAWERTLSSLFGNARKSQLKPYHGVAITVIQTTLTPQVGQLYHAVIDDGWYLSLSEAALKSQIDRSVARRKGKEPATKLETEPLNASLYIAPAALDKAKDALHLVLEWETHRRAILNNPIWYPLYHAGLVTPDTPEKEKHAVARQYYGFVPVSPDDTAYRYDPKRGEVVNARHGTQGRPQRHTSLAEESPLARLLREVRTLRADLRFREDGVHTVLTLDRQPKQ